MFDSESFWYRYLKLGPNKAEFYSMKVISCRPTGFLRLLSLACRQMWFTLTANRNDDNRISSPL